MIGVLARNDFIRLLLRLLLGGVFLFAAWDKIAQPAGFAMSVRTYQILPVSLSNLFAVCMAWSEAVAAVLLIAGLFSRQAAAALFLLLVMFVAAISTVLIKGMVIDCGCFGPDGGSLVSPWLIVRNLALMLAAIPLILHGGGRFALASAVRRRPAH